MDKSRSGSVFGVEVLKVRNVIGKLIYKEICFIFQKKFSLK